MPRRSPAGGRLGDRQGVLGGCHQRDGGTRPANGSTTLRELSRKELVRPSRHSSMEGEAEYAFLHVLARDVATTSFPAPPAPPAMSLLPSGSSRKRRNGSKTWPTCSPTTTPLRWSFPGGGATAQAAELEAPALRFLGLAAERALGLDTAAALASSERALALTPEGHPERATALARFGEAAFHAARLGEARDALEEATQPSRRPAMFGVGRGDGQVQQGASAVRGSAWWNFPPRPWPCSNRCRPARS